MLIANALDTNIFCLLLLAFINANTRKRGERALTQHRLFLGLVHTVALLLALDTLTRLVEGNPGYGFYLMSWASNVALYLLVPVVPSLYVLYVDYQIHRDRRRLKRALLPLGCLALLNVLLIVATILTGCTFFIDRQNQYHRGPLILLHTIPGYALMLYTMANVLINKSKIEKRYFATLLLFPLPPAVGAALQTLIMGTSLIWTSTTLSVLLLYFNIQDRRLDTDYLTGAFNRNILDRTLRDRIRTADRDGPFAAVLIDMTNFKSINDSHGHTAGDSALTDVVGLLKSCVRRGDIIARYGGDEFLMLLEIDRQELLDKTVRRIRRCFERFNRNAERPYRLYLSIGAALYDPAGGMGAEEFVRHIDRLMYEDKRLQQPQSELPSAIETD